MRPDFEECRRPWGEAEKFRNDNTGVKMMGSEPERKAVEMTCICCPIGCALKAEIHADGSVHVTGNKCPRGAAYGEKELTNPTRIVTTTVRIAGRKDVVVAVKTASDIPKDKIMECMKALQDIQVEAPVHIGEVILENVADTGVNIVATRGID